MVNVFCVSEYQRFDEALLTSEGRSHGIPWEPFPPSQASLNPGQPAQLLFLLHNLCRSHRGRTRPGSPQSSVNPKNSKGMILQFFQGQFCLLLSIAQFGQLNPLVFGCQKNCFARMTEKITDDDVSNDNNDDDDSIDIQDYTNATEINSYIITASVLTSQDVHGSLLTLFKYVS